MQPWPKSEAFDQIRQVLSYWRCLPNDQHMQLAVTAQEMQAYSKPRLDTDVRVLRMNQKANTFVAQLLHRILHPGRNGQAPTSPSP